MAAVALSGFLRDDGEVPAGTIVTAVFPGGCQLRCGHCIVRHRDERGTWESAPPIDFYTSELRRHVDAGTLAGAAVIGDEPLQEEVWPYVEQFLDVSTRAGRPSTLTTNGLGLAEFAERLEQFPLTSVVVSLDGVGARHDRIRGLPGAFERIKKGIRIALMSGELGRRLCVATILGAGHPEDPETVLEFVAQQGISTWIASPLLDPRVHQTIRIHPSAKSRLPSLLRVLGIRARELGVSMVASDEFGLMDEARTIAAEVGFSVKQPNRKPSLIRIDAKGRRWSWDQLTNGLVEEAARNSPASFAGISIEHVARLT